MKLKLITYCILIISFVLLSGCSNSPDYELDKRKIIDLLEKNAGCYRNKNLDCIMSTYSKEPEVIALGTEKNFIGKGFEQIKKIYKKDLGQNWEMSTYEYKNPIIYVSGDVAWLTADVLSEIKFKMQDKDVNIKLDSRLTAVCRKVEGRWKFVLTNFQHFKNPIDALKAQEENMSIGE